VGVAKFQGHPENDTLVVTI